MLLGVKKHRKHAACHKTLYKLMLSEYTSSYMMFQELRRVLLSYFKRIYIMVEKGHMMPVGVKAAL
jgi:hypothetical protein